MKPDKPDQYHHTETMRYHNVRSYCNGCKRQFQFGDPMCFCSTKICTGVLVAFCPKCAGVSDVQAKLF